MQICRIRQKVQALAAYFYSLIYPALFSKQDSKINI